MQREQSATTQNHKYNYAVQAVEESPLVENVLASASGCKRAVEIDKDSIVNITSTQMERSKKRFKSFCEEIYQIRSIGNRGHNTFYASSFLSCLGTYFNLGIVH